MSYYVSRLAYASDILQCNYTTQTFNVSNDKIVQFYNTLFAGISLIQNNLV